ncbi:MAG TPA: hypothetical protein ENJ38_01975 [Rhodospirillales bacterium]|nr:hypothetical protein [Rhodospirillales bacterium]
MIAAIASRIANHRAHLPALRLWAGRGFWAVTDQALFAGTNFLVNILLARWLDPVEYGAFAVAYSIFLLLGTLHTGLWTEPMLVYGSGRFRESFTAYQRILLGYHWRFGALVFLLFGLLAATFWLLGQPPLARSFAGLAVAAPLVLYLWLVRRGAYVLLEPRFAAYAGLAYLAIFLGLVAFLYLIGWLDTTTALVCMGVSAWVAGVWVALRVRAAASDRDVGPTGGEVLARHWGYGRWALLAGALSWIPGNIYFTVLPGAYGLKEAATLKALSNLVMPVLHFNGALAGLFVPVFVRVRANGRLLPVVKRALRILLVPPLVFLLGVLLAGETLMDWVYGGKYDAAGLSWLALNPIMAAFTGTCGAVLRAVERPDRIVQVYATTAAVSSTVGLASVIWAGLTGAVFAIVATNAIAAFLFWHGARRYTLS